MALLYYIDNEVSAYGEWDAEVTTGGATIVQSADASFPERGSAGLRCTTTEGNVAYVKKAISGSIAPGGWIWQAAWMRLLGLPTATTFGMRLDAADAYTDTLLVFSVSGKVQLYLRSDTAGWVATGFVVDLSDNKWHYVAWGVQRASGAGVADGQAVFCSDGIVKETLSAIQTYTRFASINHLYYGVPSTSGNNFVLDFDEIKIATSYPEPFIPTPLTEYPEARRTVVLFRQASADSRAFADYCVSQLGVPRANLCPLPNASANETLASYATFQSEVETDLAAWLGRNPTVAANCSCFLIGYGVPGYFEYYDGFYYTYNVSAVSRLMNYGTAFSFCTTNPLYKPSTVARLTKTGLGGKYLCARIDADTLQHAKDVLDRGLWIADCGFLPATDKLFSDEPAYRASLPCQRLRIITAALTTYANDAFVFGDTGTPAFGAAGSRAVFCDDSVSSAYTLRSASPPSICCVAVLTALYAAALGNGDAVVSVTFDAESFFEMLRLGGTLAEAVAVAVEKIDYTAVAVGSPLMTVAFSVGGYNLYRGSPGELDIDYDNPVGYLRVGESTATLAITPDIDTTYKYALRAVRNGIETPGIGCIADFTTDGAGDWTGNRPAAVINAGLEQREGGLLRVYWHYLTEGACVADFALWYGIEAPTGVGAADAVETYDADRLYFHDFTLTDGLAYYVRITARTVAGVESEPVTLGPLAVDATAPEESSTYVSQTF